MLMGAMKGAVIGGAIGFVIYLIQKQRKKKAQDGELLDSGIKKDSAEKDSKQE